MNEQVKSPVGQGGRLFWLWVSPPPFGGHQEGRKGNCLEEETDERSEAQAFHKDKAAQSSSFIIGLLFYDSLRR
jgi:hypothetical protein